MKGIVSEIECSYCNSICDEDKLTINGKHYCCYGCVTLDKVIQELNADEVEVNIAYKQFDLPEYREKIISFQNNKVYKVSLSLPTIHCASCVELLEDLPQFLPQVIRAQVNFETRTATFLAENELPISKLAQFLDRIGYQPRFNLSLKEEQEQKKKSRTQLFKIAFAGFCFGNIMLYSFPHYFGLEKQSFSDFHTLFLGLSVVLSIPLVFYSGGAYLKRGLQSALKKKAHIDIPISLGILCLFTWSLYEILSRQGIGYLDSLSGLIFFLLVGSWFQSKIYDQVAYKRHLQEFIPLIVRKKQGDSFIWAKFDALSKGDILVVKNGEVIPVDGVLLSHSAQIDYSFISGEQNPEKVTSGHKIYAGGRQTSGEIELQLIETPNSESLLSSWSDHGNKSHEAEWSNKISGYFTWAVLSIAIISGLVWSFTDPAKALFVVCAVLIVACPCALALSTPFTYGNILRVFSSNNFFVKQSEALHSLAHISYFIWDKTGTLTQRNGAQINYKGQELSDVERSAIYALTGQSTHPLSLAVHQKLLPVNSLKLKGFKEHVGKGIEALCAEHWCRLGSAQFLGVQSDNQSAAVHVEIDGKYKGYFEIKQSYRKGVSGLLNALYSHYKVGLLSGDNPGEKPALQQLFSNWAEMLFNLKPKQKAAYISKLQFNEKVGMIGDGVNDSLALSTANFGIALTENLNDFYPGSDAVLLSTDIQKVPQFMELARYSKSILKWSLIFSLAYNLTGLAFAVSGQLTPVIAAILMPLSSITVVSLTAILVRVKAHKLKLI